MEVTQDIDGNVSRIEGFVRHGTELGVRVMGFPEWALTGYGTMVLQRLERQAVEEALDHLGQLADRSGICLLVGTPTWEGDRTRNSVAILESNREPRLVHKQQLLREEQGRFDPGARTGNPTFPVDEWCAGVIICREQNYPGLAANLREQGVQLLFNCCAHYYSPMEARWKIDKNVALPIARATENHMVVVKVNCVGSMEGRVSLGNSLIVGPNGVVAARAGDREEALISFDLEPGIMDWDW